MTETPTKYFEDVTAGEVLPPIEFAVTLTALVMYAGATWDFHRYHYDAEFVASLGIPAPFMDGQMLGALLARQVMQWSGPDGFVRMLNYRQRASVYAGDTITLRGKVSGTSVENGRGLAHCALSVTGPGDRVVTRDATATVELRRRPS
jgi:acyl dehydratase